MTIMREICEFSPVIPVLVIDDIATAVPLANALVKGGLRVVEVTLRTPAALEAIRAITDAHPNALVGAGTVLTPADVRAVKSAGASFAVSPGTTADLLIAAAQQDLPLLPGAASPSEVMQLSSQGFDMIKFFPAEPSGGVPWLNAVSGPFPGVSFCPTGGITAHTAPAYLSLPNVPCVGGSWITPKSAIDAHDWGRIEALAHQAKEKV